MSSVTVIERFFSIQGESSWAGLPCWFIRLAGCPLRCKWCDTSYAYIGGEEIDIATLVQEAAKFDLVEVTGGEPLSQRHSIELIGELCETSTVLVETSGALLVKDVDIRATVIMDVKCPSSNMHDHMKWDNFDILKDRFERYRNITGVERYDEVKFVIADKGDYDHAFDTVSKFRDYPVRWLVSPIMSQLAPKQLAEWVLYDHIPVRLQLQLHKLLWDPNARGV